MKLYIVQMYKWGDDSEHSYIEGVYTNRRLANKHGKSEMRYRSGKYEPKIWVHDLDKPRITKYLRETIMQKKMHKGMKRVRQQHPEWFDKQGKFKW